MSDMLDFYGDFWEDLLDCEPPVVDNNYRKGDLTHAAVDYLGVCPLSVRLPELGKAKTEWIAMSKANRRTARTANLKHYPIENR